jgi:hypothetical protein
MAISENGRQLVVSNGRAFMRLLFRQQKYFEYPYMMGDPEKIDIITVLYGLYSRLPESLFKQYGFEVL